ncbi:MAG: hypothetical protein ACTSPY_15410 [Candidatus Helarchaeota archaeon]
MSQLKIDGGALTKAFVDEVRINSDGLHLFNRFSGEKFTNWRNNMGDLVDVADFLLEAGADILTFWMTNIYCFDKKRLNIQVPKKLSPVDSLIIAQYTFTKDEVKVIKEVLQEYQLSDYGDAKAATTIFSNSMKTIAKYLSKILNTDYNIFTNKLEHKEKKGQIIIIYEGAGRIQGF